MKKFIFTVLCSALLLSSSVPSFAWTNVSEGASWSQAAYNDVVTLTTTDYTLVNGVPYITFQTLSQAAGYAEYDFAVEFNPSNKTLKYYNTGWNSSIHDFTALFKVDQCDFVYTYAGIDTSILTAANPPRIINNRFCLPIETLKTMNLANSVSYNSINNTYTISIVTS